MGWVTTAGTKERMLSYFKDYFERGMMAVRSMELLDEMKSLVREGSSIAAYGRNKDDRVMATGLASAAFAEQVQPRLIQQRVTRHTQEVTQKALENGDLVNQNVANYLKRIGMYG